MPEEHNQPPSTIKEVGIHIGYMRQDISDLTDLVREQSKNYATKSDLEAVRNDFEKRVSRLEGWNIWQVRLVIGAVILAVLALVLKGGKII